MKPAALTVLFLLGMGALVLGLFLAEPPTFDRFIKVAMCIGIFLLCALGAFVVAVA